MASTSYARAAAPVRTIALTIAMVLLTALALLLIYAARQVLVWMIIALFFTVALAPVVDWIQRRLPWCPRIAGTIAVFALVVVALGGLITLFAVPLAREGAAFAQQLPQLIDDTRAGRGPIGSLLVRTNALEWVRSHQEQISATAASLTTPAAGVLRGIATGLAGTITVFVLALLMVLEAPRITAASLNLIDNPDTRDRVRQVSTDCAKSITGYISGNLLISVVCGILTYIALKVLGVPFAGLIAVFVAVADLIPLIGATLGAIVAVIAAGVHSLPALIVMIVFFILYQQLENHVLQPVILARTVKLNPLAVLVAILVGVDLAGILGALLAIPVAGIIQVVIRDVWSHRRGRPKPVPTTGEDENPIIAPTPAARASHP